MHLKELGKIVILLVAFTAVITKVSSSHALMESELAEPPEYSKSAAKKSMAFAKDIAGDTDHAFIGAFEKAMQASLPRETDTSRTLEATNPPKELPSHRFNYDTRVQANLLHMLRMDKTEPRIWYGEITTAFPDAIAIRDSLEKSICTGTLISPKAVLTAKHCHCGKVNQKVYIGSNFRKASPSDYVQVKKSIPYTSCDKPDKEGDIAVLLLERDITDISPRQIAPASQINQAKSGRIVGFGLTEDMTTKSIGPRRVADVPLASTDCNGSVTTSSGLSITDEEWYQCQKGTELVAKGLLGNHVDTCKGDSGGPLLVQGPDNNYYLAGATSRAVSYPGAAICGDGGIYARVNDAVLTWLKELNVPFTVASL